MQVREERQRLHEAKQRPAWEALIVLSSAGSQSAPRYRVSLIKRKELLQDLHHHSVAHLPWGAAGNEIGSAGTCPHSSSAEGEVGCSRLEATTMTPPDPYLIRRG